MKRPKFEERLFSDRPSDLEGQSAVEDYLNAHPEMQELKEQWQATEQFLISAQGVLAPPGFAERWKRRLEDGRQRASRRQAIGFLVFSASLALALLLTLLGQGPLTVGDLTHSISELLNSLISMFVFVRILLEVSASLAQKIPVMAWLMIGLMFFLTPLAWLALYQNFVFAKE